MSDIPNTSLRLSDPQGAGYDHVMRLTAGIRLSNLTDATTSPETQRSQIQGYAALYGHKIVHWSTDLDVSGAVSVFDRPELGAVFKHPDDWDGIIVSKLDRLSRSLLDFATLLQWCSEHGKTIISVAEKLDFSTSAGRMFANILISFAQFERERISERIKDSVKTRKRNGYYFGGRVPYGMKLVPKDNHYVMAVDESLQPVLTSAAEKIIEGYSASRVCRELTSAGVKPPNGNEWRSGELRDILSNPDVIPAGLLEKVKPALEAGTRAKHRKGDYLLSGLAYCLACGKIMHGNLDRTDGRSYRYYKCTTHGRIPAGKVEDAVEESVLDMFGEEQYGERVLVRQVDAAKLRREIKKRISLLDPDDDDYDASLASLRAELAAVKVMPDRWERRLSGRTVAAEWADWSMVRRRSWMAANGMTVHVGKPDRRGDDPAVVIDGGELPGTADRLTGLA